MVHDELDVPGEERLCPAKRGDDGGAHEAFSFREGGLGSFPTSQTSL